MLGTMFEKIVSGGQSGVDRAALDENGRYLATAGMMIVLLLLLSILGCEETPGSEQSGTDPTRQAERDRMVEDQIISRGIKDPAVLAAMRRVPRHRFVPTSYSRRAYADGALPIGYGQTISQPSLVAFMTEALALRGTEKVLEIGTGSGYQAAVLAEIVPHVFSIEILEPLAKQAARTLADLDYKNVTVRAGDGYRGWPEEAPFDAIIVTAASDHVPQPLLEQLAIGGRLILPLGESLQQLVLYRRTRDGYERRALVPFVQFVPLVRKDHVPKPPDQY
jgi:protein-L-isoaspartate(D-aspartate) O-methyltransferase